MIPLHCPASPLREPLSQRPRRAGCPTEARLLRRCQRWVVAGAALDTVAFAEESLRQPPSLVAQAKAGCALRAAGAVFLPAAGTVSPSKKWAAGADCLGNGETPQDP